MKLPLVFVILFTCALNCSAQEFKKVRVGFAFGAGSGIVASQELGYRVTDKILIGIRLEGKAFFASTETGSYGVNSQYYFSNRNLRPFVGLGISLYHSGLVGDPFYGYGSRNEETVLGFYPRAGFDLGHLSFIMDWNIMATAKATIYPPLSQNLPPYTGYINGNYLSLKLGFFFGGGRKKSK